MAVCPSSCGAGAPSDRCHHRTDLHLQRKEWLAQWRLLGLGGDTLVALHIPHAQKQIHKTGLRGEHVPFYRKRVGKRCT